MSSLIIHVEYSQLETSDRGVICRNYLHFQVKLEG